MIVPVDISVKRYYRVFVSVDEDQLDDDEKIEELTREEVFALGDALDECLDEELELEDGDIDVCYIDRDGVQREE